MAKIRVAGAVLAAGAAAWAVGTAMGGENIGKEILFADTVTGLGYLAGLFSLALVLLSVRATGHRKGRALPIAQFVLLPLAFAFNLVSFGYLGQTYEDLPVWSRPFDLGWPLANLLMIFTGIAVVRVGRLRRSLAWHLLLCGLWFPVAMVGQGLGGAAAAYVSVVWLLITYTAVGVRLLLRPADALPGRVAGA